MSATLVRETAVSASPSSLTDNLDASAGAVAREVLAEHGNMSSPTVLFVLKRLMEAGARRPCVALAFGPGLTLVTRPPSMSTCCPASALPCIATVVVGTESNRDDGAVSTSHRVTRRPVVN